MNEEKDMHIKSIGSNQKMYSGVIEELNRKTIKFMKEMKADNKSLREIIKFKDNQVAELKK